MISALVPAYNEEGNLEGLLTRLVVEKQLDEIVVVASGCTDRTVEIARSFEPRVRVMVQKTREGKSSAINLFLQSTHADIVIMESADTIPRIFCIPNMIACFRDPNVGMVGARSVPIKTWSFMGGMSSLLWNSIHQLSLRSPKLGELVAFRRVFDSIPQASSVDEASIESLIVARGLRLVYQPLAIVRNKGPENMHDWILQRKRIHLGHINLMMAGHKVASMNRISSLRAVLKAANWTPGGFAVLATFVVVEAYVRLRAGSEWKKNRTEQTIWETAKSTKELGS